MADDLSCRWCKRERTAVTHVRGGEHTRVVLCPRCDGGALDVLCASDDETEDG